MKKKKKTQSRIERKHFYLFILPWIIGFLAFVLIPMIMSLCMSFTKWDLLTEPTWVGFKNYIRAFTEDPLFYQSLKVTFVYSLFSVPLGLIASLTVALLLNQITRSVKFFRTIYYLPVIVSGVAMMVLWAYIFNPQMGLLNQILKMFGINGPGWIYDSKWAMPSLIIMSLWNIGGTVIIWLAGLSGVDEQLYESARLDGASRWQQFINITLPTLSPTIFFNLVNGVIGALQTFNQAYIMTDGGPKNSTLFFNFYLWKKAFKDFEMGYASALAWVLFVIIMILTLLVFKWSSMWVYYESEGE
ncbi:carbohydrate ABC transporter permease [Enterococcus sp. DIV0086]|uniref:carbohydrate ABC transporter permease n=1 Tax=Enterococcus sp. DIV0086 TaxID=2774655 RepID=UPI003D2867D0